MTREERLFIQIISDHLAKRKTEPIYDADWGSISQLSRQHQVDGIIYHQCKSFLPDDMRPEYDIISGASVFLYVNNIAAIQEIESTFGKANIPFLVIKGLPIAQLYPIPAYRTMGDCDIVVHSSVLKTAQSLIADIGYIKTGEYMQHEWTYRKQNFILELHDALVREDDYISPNQEKFFSRFSEYVTNDRLDWSFHFLFLIMHLRKHMIKNGVGIRQFMDLAVVISNIKDLKWDWIERALEELRLTQFAHACYDLIHEWFGTPIEVEYEHLSHDFREKVTETVLSNGVFGFSDSRNINNIEKNAIVMGKVPRWLNRVKALFFSVFLPYRIMRRYPGFQYVNNKRYLMPVAWLHRLGIIIIRKDKSASIHTLQKYFISKSELDDREELLSKMGLKYTK